MRYYILNEIINYLEKYEIHTFTEEGESKIDKSEKVRYLFNRIRDFEKKQIILNQSNNEAEIHEFLNFLIVIFYKKYNNIISRLFNRDSIISEKEFLFLTQIDLKNDFNDEENKMIFILCEKEILSKDIKLTEKGKGLMVNINQLIGEELEDFIKDFTKEELDLLDKIVKNVLSTSIK